jgi:hypothetical protein
MTPTAAGLLIATVVFHGSAGLAARGESLVAFDGRCILAGCVAPPLNTPGIRGRRALPARRLARLGATPHFHHGLLDRQAPAANQDAQVLRDFKTRVDKYVDVRKTADDSAPSLEETADPAKIRAAQQSLAERIGAARRGAKQGEIFTPEITAYFRRLLRPEVKQGGTKNLIKDDNPGRVPFNVNGPYPEKEPLATVPPNVLASLPKLPKDIEYRFVSKHLILRDARCNLVIDYIPNAIA